MTGSVPVLLNRAGGVLVDREGEGYWGSSMSHLGLLGCVCIFSYSKMVGSRWGGSGKERLGVVTVPCLPLVLGKAGGVLSLSTLPAETGHFFSFFVLFFFGFETGWP